MSDNADLFALASPEIRREEGCETHAYPDPQTKGEPYTIGVGHTGGVKPGDVWTVERVEAVFLADLTKTAAMMDGALSWWRTLSLPRQAVLLSMGFQMGVAGLRKFQNTLAHMRQAQYAAAAEGMLNSLWAKQTPERAHRLAEQMRTGMPCPPV